MEPFITNSQLRSQRHSSPVASVWTAQTHLKHSRRQGLCSASTLQVLIWLLGPSLTLALYTTCQARPLWILSVQPAVAGQNARATWMSTRSPSRTGLAFAATPGEGRTARTVPVLAIAAPPAPEELDELAGIGSTGSAASTATATARSPTVSFAGTL